MAGELWRGLAQCAVEPSYGTVTQPATRRLYYDDPVFTLVRQPRPHMFATATRDNVRALTLGPQEIGGTLKIPLSSSEIIEWLLMCINGSTTPTSPHAGVQLWTFTPGNTLASATFEWMDAANPWLISGAMVDKIQFKGSANGPHEVTATVFGKAITATTMTGALSTRTPDITEGWETKLYIDAFGGSPLTTEVDGFLINWDVTLSANLARKYFAQNSNSLGAAPIGVLGVDATLTFEAANGQALTEYGDFNVALASPTYRVVGLSFGNNAIIASTYKTFTNIVMPGAWTAFDLGQKDSNTRCYQLKYQYVFDPTNTFGVEVICQNNRAAAWV